MFFASKNIWSGRRDSNPRPSPWQGDALPLSHFRISLEVLKPPDIKFGWDSRTRTCGMTESKSVALPTWLYPNIIHMGWMMGFEPTSAGATILCLNHLTTSTKIILAYPQGFEPRTHGLEGRCSILLSYGYNIGAGEGNRTLAISLEG